MVELLTVKELARREKVSQLTVRRWIAKGAVEVHRNPSGYIRIVERRAVILMLREPDDKQQSA